MRIREIHPTVRPTPWLFLTTKKESKWSVGVIQLNCVSTKRPSDTSLLEIGFQLVIIEMLFYGFIATAFLYVCAESLATKLLYYTPKSHGVFSSLPSFDVFKVVSLQI